MSELSDFGQTVHVLCMGSAEHVQGLQWAFDQKVPADRNYRVYRGGISQDMSKYEAYDFVILLLDMAQPVPTELISKLAQLKKGLCAFIQPTPGQLLALNKVSDWEAVAWDGVNLEEIAKRASRRLGRLEKEIKEKALFSSVNEWMKERAEEPGELVCIRAPQSWQGQFNGTLDKTSGVFSVGCRNSQANLRLPFTGSEDILELRLRGGKWGLQVLSNAGEIRFDGESDHLKVGDELEIGGALFQIRREAGLQELYDKSHQVLGLLSEYNDNEADESLEKNCRRLLSESHSGELSLRSGHRSGTIFFFAGVVVHAMTGSVSGEKALLRMLSWEWDGQGLEQSFRNVDPAQFPIGTIHFDLIRFARAARANKDAMQEVSSFVPAPSLRLEINPRGFLDKVTWSAEEARILAAIGEFTLVRDIINFCPLPDAQILKTLVQLRRQKLISPARSTPV